MCLSANLTGNASYANNLILAFISSNERSKCRTSWFLKARITRSNTEFRSLYKLFHRCCSILAYLCVLVGVVYSHVASMIAADLQLRDAHGGRNQWVWSLVRSTIKRKILVDQEIKGCLKAGSSDQEQNLAIKNFDRRRRWKYRVYSGDYPL